MPRRAPREARLRRHWDGQRVLHARRAEGVRLALELAARLAVAPHTQPKGHFGCEAEEAPVAVAVAAARLAVRRGGACLRSLAALATPRARPGGLLEKLLLRQLNRRDGFVKGKANGSDAPAPNKERYPLQAQGLGYESVQMGGVGKGSHAQLVLTSPPCMT